MNCCLRLYEGSYLQQEASLINAQLPRFLTALPVYNESEHVTSVLDQVLRFSPDVLVVDDGSTDGTSEIVSRRRDVRVARHETNLGYGAALTTAFEYAMQHQYDVVVTVDCDGQHEPQRIPQFVNACSNQNVDIVSGSRYLRQFEGDSQPPEQRRRVNQIVTAELNDRLSLNLTDAFCGFKAYRVDALRCMKIEEVGYAMPLELWVQAARRGLRIIELPVPLIYLDETRSFGGTLDDTHIRLEYYRLILIAASPRLDSRPTRGENYKRDAVKHAMTLNVHHHENRSIHDSLQTIACTKRLRPIAAGTIAGSGEPDSFSKSRELEPVKGRAV